MRKRLGRPRVPESQKRNRILRFVVTKAEDALIRAKAKQLHLELSEYLRFVAIPKPQGEH